MRIITGSARGTKLKAPPGDNTRPTADRIKESLFNIIGNFVIDTAVLDLFSGTGNLALEALSRGAAKAIMVDTAKPSIEAIRYNTERTHLTAKTTILNDDVFSAIKKLHHKREKFDIIFCDPPYHRNLCLRVMEALEQYPLLTPDGVIIFEHALDDNLPEGSQNLTLLRQQRYGATTQISIYELRDRATNNSQEGTSL